MSTARRIEKSERIWQDRGNPSEAPERDQSVPLQGAWMDEAPHEFTYPTTLERGLEESEQDWEDQGSSSDAHECDHRMRVQGASRDETPREFNIFKTAAELECSLRKSLEEREFDGQAQGNSSALSDSGRYKPINSLTELELLGKVLQFDSLLSGFISEVSSIAKWNRLMISDPSNTLPSSPSGVKVMIDYEEHEALKKYEKLYEQTAAELEQTKKLLQEANQKIELLEFERVELQNQPNQVRRDQGSAISDEDGCVPQRFRSEDDEAAPSQVIRARSEDEANLRPSPGGSRNRQWRASIEADQRRKEMEIICSAMH